MAALISSSSRRFGARHPLFVLVALASLVGLFLTCTTLGHSTVALLTLPATWPRQADRFLISAERDGFDVTFANYSRSQHIAGEGHEDVVPPILHHIVLGDQAPRAKWMEARKSCLEMHPGWEAHMWDDEKAARFVQDKFPAFKATWDGYRFPIQRIDALRYLVLYEYGGVILDMDLKCKRSLGPLRRFNFVAPAAFPQGFSIGFMMASRHNAFVGELVRNLQVFNRRWFGMPYPTVMFSTGCHYASTVHTMQPDRSAYKVLAGPRDNFKLHSLNGPVSTPIFDHLGSSSWHSYDAAMIVTIGRLGGRWKAWFLVPVAMGVTLFLLLRAKRRVVAKRHAMIKI